MAEITILKREDIRLDTSKAYDEQTLFEGTCPGIVLRKCRLGAGERIRPEVYAREDRMQIFFFVRPSGYIRAGNAVFPIDEQSVFVPDFDRDCLELAAGEADLEYIHISGPMTEIDLRQMANCQYVLPRMVRLSESIEYTERFTQESGSKVVSHSIIAGRHLGRYTMGWNIGAGPDFIGQHTHPTLEQWYFMIDGSDFTYVAGGSEVPVREGDISFTPHGTSHGSECTEDGYINYVWFELNRAWEEL